MKLDNNAHSVFLLHYHLVLVIKYRRKVFDDNISNRAKEIFEYIAPNYNITLQEWNHDKDYVHILFKAHPNSEISKFINAYKSASSRLLKKKNFRRYDKSFGKILLELKFLFAYNRWFADGCYQKIHRKSR